MSKFLVYRILEDNAGSEELEETPNYSSELLCHYYLKWYEIPFNSASRQKIYKDLLVVLTFMGTSIKIAVNIVDIDGVDDYKNAATILKLSGMQELLLVRKLTFFIQLQFLWIRISSWIVFCLSYIFWQDGRNESKISRTMQFQSFIQKSFQKTGYKNPYWLEIED